MSKLLLEERVRDRQIVSLLISASTNCDFIGNSEGTWAIKGLLAVRVVVLAYS